MTSSLTLSSSTPRTGARWPRILSEQLVPIPEPLRLALQPGPEASPRATIRLAARALLDGTPLGRPPAWPTWLAPHQIPAAERLTAILARFDGALLADAVGLGKSYVALAVALARHEPFALMVPTVLVSQWRALLSRFSVQVPIITHESLSASRCAPLPSPSPYRLLVVDEAHRFRNPETNRYRSLARMAVGCRVLLVTATPVHNRLADLFHLFRLFLRDRALAALGVPSLRRAAEDAPLYCAAAARLVVARSRERVLHGYPIGPVPLNFPRNSGAEAVRAAPTSPKVLADLVTTIRRLEAGGSAAPLLRLILLRRLASSLAAFRATLLRHEAYVDLAARAGAEGRSLSPREFQHCFPRAAESDLQLGLFPLLLDNRGLTDATADRPIIGRLREILTRAPAEDPKADALERLLADRSAKTIVFTDAQPTVRYLLRRLRSRRVAAVFGTRGRFGAGEASRQEVLRAFAPQAQNGPIVPPALETDLLIATDLLSEGLNLQDAERVVHYDVPWSPARLAQRVGRIDRLGSQNESVSSVTFLPPEPLASALTLEERLAAKVAAQAVAGADGRFDWCDLLAELQRTDGDPVAGSVCAAVRGTAAAAVLIVRIGSLSEAIIVEDDAARAAPAAAARFLADAWDGSCAPLDRDALQRAIQLAGPLVRARLAAMQDARWRASDRDRLARRLIPWVLSAARRAARRGDARQLRALDKLVCRLAAGMTAGEELLLDELLTRPEPLTVDDLLAWDNELPPVGGDDAAISVELVAALLVSPASQP
jgi:superfamily II DNA or RNA helicase